MYAPADAKGPIELRMQMHEAAVAGDAETIRRLLLLPGGPMAARVGQEFMGDMTPLHEVIGAQKEAEAVAVARLLIPHSDLSARNHLTQSPLVSATDCRFPVLARELLAAGCDPNGRDAKGATALIYAACMGSLPGLELLEDLLSVADTLAADEKGDTALMMAAGADNDEGVRLLLPKSDPHARNADGRTAFLQAANYGSFDSLKLLAPASDPQARDAKGQTALVLAAAVHRPECVAFLLPLVDWQAIDDKGRNAFDAAIQHRVWGVADEIAFFAESRGQSVPGLRDMILRSTPAMFKKTRAILEAQELRSALEVDAQSREISIGANSQTRNGASRRSARSL